MQNLEVEMETIQIGIYCNIVQNLLKKHEILSVSKTTLFTYLIKKEHFKVAKIYNANNSQDVIYKAVSLLAGEYNEYCENIGYILKAIHLLGIKNKILISNGFLRLEGNINVDKCFYKESPFLEKAIEESKKITDRQFMKEVITNV